MPPRSRRGVYEDRQARCRLGERIIQVVAANLHVATRQPQGHPDSKLALFFLQAIADQPVDRRLSGAAEA